MLQEAPYDAPIPHGLAGAGHLARLGQPATDVPNRQAVVADPGTDLADHAGFVPTEVIAGLPAPLILRHVAVPIGGATAHMHRPDPGGMALATSMPRDHRGPLILGHPPLPLQPQGVFGALPQGAVEAHDLDTRASARIHQEHLLGVLPGQALWRVPREPGHGARRDHLAQTLQRRAHQRGPALACVETLPRLGHGQPLARHPLPPGRSRARHGLGFLGLLRRHTRRDRSLGGVPPCGLPPPCCRCWAPSAWGDEPARGAGRRVMGTTRAYACATQAGLPRLGANVMRPSRVRLPVRSRRATRASLLPWREAFTRWHTLEWRPQQSLTIPVSQLCAWNARRVLSQKVGNFVGNVLTPPCGTPVSG
jgi:hypothetical protein